MEVLYVTYIKDIWRAIKILTIFSFQRGALEAIPLDFQTLHCGSPLYDLLYFINLGSDYNFREKYFQATIDHYYSELCAALQRLEVNPDEVYSKADFDYEYEQVGSMNIKSIFVACPQV